MLPYVYHKKVWVYRNLTRRCFSVMLDGKVVAHPKTVMLTEARFHVREGGRQRVLREKRKNVHAFVVGYMVDLDRTVGLNPDDFVSPVSYNPYKAGSFVRVSTGEAVGTATAVVLTMDKGMRAVGLEAKQ